jgi:hypothetical protein
MCHVGVACKAARKRLQAAVNPAASAEDSDAITTASKRAEESVRKIGYVKTLNETVSKSKGAAKK